MRKRKKIMLIFLAALAVVFILSFVRIWFLYKGRKQQAAEMAQTYLDNRYEQKMQLDHVIYRALGDPARYVVFFTPENQPDLLFNVIVQDELTILGEGLYEFGKSTCPDNYLLQYFTYHLEQEIDPDILQIWGEDASFKINVEDNGLYSHTAYPGIFENMTVQEMDPLINYGYIIIPNLVLDQTSMEAEAQNIFSLLQLARKRALHPNYFLLCYRTGQKEKTSLLGKPKYVEKYIRLTELEQITSFEQMLQEMDAQRTRWLE